MARDGVHSLGVAGTRGHTLVDSSGHFHGLVPVRVQVGLIGCRSEDSTEGWRVMAKDGVSGRNLDIRCKVLINAAGAYVDTLNAAADIKTNHQHILSKGIHLIVPRIGDSGKVLTFFADAGCRRDKSGPGGSGDCRNRAASVRD